MSDNLIARVLSGLPPAQRQDGAKMLVILSQKESTIKDLASPKSRPSNIHTIAEKLRSQGVVTRYKRRGLNGARSQFVYSLATGIDLGEIRSLAPTPQPVDDLRLSVSKLPDFDPEWPMQLQESWIAAYSSTVKLLHDRCTGRLDR